MSEIRKSESLQKAQADLTARPGRGFAWRPLCRVLQLRGRYLGCRHFEPATTFESAHEVLLDYQDGDTRKWHYGPAATGCHPDHKAVLAPEDS
jgi:hypothetical protein